MRNVILLSGLLAAILAAGCSNADKGTNPPVDVDLRLTPTQAEVTAAADAFGLDVFKQVVGVEPEANIFLSPLSISIALGMVLNGAQGETREAIIDCLRLSGAELDEINATYAELMQKLPALDRHVTMEIANSVWYRDGFPINDDFLMLTDSIFDAEVAALDFDDEAAADIINDWVTDKTHGKIDGIVRPPINRLTMLFLINAVYFYGDWTIQFDSAETRPAPFHLDDGSTTECQLMFMHEDLQYYETDDLQAVRLPYGDGDFAMLALLPTEAVPVNTLIESLTVDQWRVWLDGLTEVEIDLFMPRFTFDFEITLNEILADMGMGIAFAPNAADLTGIADVSDLHISAVRHKAFVDVNESGTEAAAVTSVEVGITSVGPTHPVVRLDRPFAFIIYERSSGTMLFAGKVAEPTT